MLYSEYLKYPPQTYKFKLTIQKTKDSIFLKIFKLCL